MTKDEALDLALYALKELVAQTEARLFAVKHDHVALQNAREAITAIKQARSAPVQDKGPWIAGVVQGQPKRVYIQSEDFKHDVRLYVDGDFASDGQRFEYAEQMAQQFNTTPPAAQRQWVGLEEEEICFEALKKDQHGIGFIKGAEWAEATLREKNGGAA